MARRAAEVPCVAIEHVSPDTLTPAGYNPRTMSPEARKRLARSIREFGFVDPVIARRSDGLVIGGHQRLVAAQEVGLAFVLMDALGVRCG